MGVVALTEEHQKRFLQAGIEAKYGVLVPALMAKPHSLRGQVLLLNEMHAWATANCIDKWQLVGASFMFVDEQDAITFYLTYGT